MVRPNDDIAITGGDAYKVRSYEKAARSVAGHHEDVSKCIHTSPSRETS